MEYQTILHNHCSKTSLILAQEQAYSSMEKKLRSLKTNPGHYGQLIFDKGGREIQCRKILSSNMVLGTSSQDGDMGRYILPPHTTKEGEQLKKKITRTSRKSNSMEVWQPRS